MKYLGVLTDSKPHFDHYMDHIFSQKIGCCV